ncbi:MAG: glutamine synthetase family protein [Alphaproteobacteria bacterium]|nr:glutamine synthetase family protein [Alphaproteobacteria bacterium]
MPKDSAMSEAEAFLEANPGVKTVELLMPDMCGILRGKRLTRNSFKKLYSGSVRTPGSLYVLDVTGQDVPTMRLGIADGDPDKFCRPAPGTLKPVPWAEQPLGQVLASMTEDDGAPLYSDPRAILASTVARLGELSLRPSVAIEQEFYLLDRKRGPGGTPQPAFSEDSGYRQSTTQVAGMEELYDFETFLAEVARCCEIQGLPAEAASKEYAPGQYEINLHYVADALTACDHAVMLKRVIKAVGRRQGLVASFMAKPFEECAGSGTHVHVSLYDNDGANAFAKGARQEINGMQVGAPLLHAVGGLIACMTESMAIFAPNANSYRRFRPGLFVPVSPSWGVNNRSAGIRIPPSDDQALRIEHRNAGADTNPYLATAAILAGIHHGLTAKIDPPPASDGDRDPEGLPELPLDWHTALDRFRDGTILPAYLGEKYHRVYETCRRYECEAFKARIQPLDYEWYLRTV